MLTHIPSVGCGPVSEMFAPIFGVPRVGVGGEQTVRQDERVRALRTGRCQQHQCGAPPGLDRTGRVPPGAGKHHNHDQPTGDGDSGGGGVATSGGWQQQQQQMLCQCQRRLQRQQ
uniref:(northern house mosquito) hypothetical protein n=1 Tax=Culex pipiens TaxID=7175 RepID=A0A8D8GH18_CULPI